MVKIEIANQNMVPRYSPQEPPRDYDVNKAVGIFFCLSYSFGPVCPELLRAMITRSGVFKIPFGIGRMHPDIAFDPTRFANPQLVLEWNLLAGGAIAATTWVTDSLQVDIIADVIDEAPARPSGYLMTKEVTEYVATASAEHRVELPVDYDYRTLYVKSYLDNKCPVESIDKVEHSVNEQKYRPFDIYTDDWLEWLKEWYGLWHTKMWAELQAAATEQRNMYLRGDLAVSLEAATAATDILLDSLANCQVNMTGANIAVDDIFIMATGALPFGTFAWPYGDPEDPEEWLKFEYTDKSRLKVLAHAHAPRVKVFLTQHRMY